MATATCGPNPTSKPNLNQVFEELRSKAASTEVNSALATKADLVQVEESLQGKASRSAVAAALQKRARITDVEAALATKAEMESVTEALALKADHTAMKDALSQKASHGELSESIQASETRVGAEASKIEARNLEANQVIGKTISTLHGDLTTLQREIGVKIGHLQEVQSTLATKESLTREIATRPTPTEVQGMVSAATAPKADQVA